MAITNRPSVARRAIRFEHDCRVLATAKLELDAPARHKLRETLEDKEVLRLATLILLNHCLTERLRTELRGLSITLHARDDEFYGQALAQLARAEKNQAQFTARLPFADANRIIQIVVHDKLVAFGVA